MRIITEGIEDKETRKLCKEALKFYGKELLGPRLYKNITLELLFEELPNKINALCNWTDDNHTCREFVVSLNNKLNKKTMLIALAHEMVHIKQFARGELKDYMRSDKVKWKGQVFCLSEVEYWSCPWEKEAYENDVVLYKKFKQYYKEK